MKGVIFPVGILKFDFRSSLPYERKERIEGCFGLKVRYLVEPVSCRAPHVRGEGGEWMPPPPIWSQIKHICVSHNYFSVASMSCPLVVGTSWWIYRSRGSQRGMVLVRRGGRSLRARGFLYPECCFVARPLSLLPFLASWGIDWSLCSLCRVATGCLAARSRYPVLGYMGA